MEELGIVDLGIAENIPESVCQGGLDLEERAQADFIDLFEAVPIYV